MTNVFISYNRQSEAIAKTLVNDIEGLGHIVWFDKELSGGQIWWDKILTTIRDCDVFVFVLNPESLNSTACKREYSYAADLGKPILPVLVSGGVSTNLLPPALSKIQFVDHRQQDRDAAISLARALTTIPPPEPLPDPLPTPPEVPISYLGSLTVQVETSSTLNYEEQSALVVDLKRSLRDSESADDARTLLEKLRQRRDLFATIAEEIDELLTLPKKESHAETGSPTTKNVEQDFLKKAPEAGREPPGAKITQPTATNSQSATNLTRPLRPRLKSAIIGAILGTIAGIAALTTARGSSEVLVFSLLTGTGGAIAGAISGTNPRQIVSSLIGATIGWIIVSLANGYDSFAVGGAFGSPAGAIIGAIIGVIFLRQKKCP